jgi:Outer membrane protein beta-barrel domain
MSIRRALQAAAFAATCISLPLSQAHAQLTLSLGGGGTWPLSSLSNYYTTGYNVLASLGVGLPEWPVGIRVDGMFNQMKSQSDVDAGTLQMWTLNADLVYNVVPLKVAMVTPYLVGGGGYYNDSYHITAVGTSIGAGGSTHDNNFGLNGGLGLRFGVPTLSIFVESRFHYIFLSGGHLEFVPLTAGVTF